jgi:hypothetical protein
MHGMGKSKESTFYCSIVRYLTRQGGAYRDAHDLVKGILSRDVVGHTRTLKMRLQRGVVTHASRKGRQQNRRINMAEKATLGFEVPLDLKFVL